MRLITALSTRLKFALPNRATYRPQGHKPGNDHTMAIAPETQRGTSCRYVSPTFLPIHGFLRLSCTDVLFLRRQALPLCGEQVS